MADVKAEYVPADGEKKAYAEIIVDVLNEAKEDYSEVIKLIERGEVENDA
jgi:hypothetical protein